MDLRAFGIGPRTWLEELIYQRRDFILIALGIVIVLISVSLGFLGLGKFWVPDALIHWATGG